MKEYMSWKGKGGCSYGMKCTIEIKLKKSVFTVMKIELAFSCLPNILEQLSS
jgi:hypothetical protein